jgi:hypothetical protein
MDLPLVNGALMLAASDDDSRKYLMYGMVGLILVVLVFESFGYSIGTLGATITTAFPLLLGYVFGQKEAEARK